MIASHRTNLIYHVAHGLNKNPIPSQVKNHVQNGITPIQSFQTPVPSKVTDLLQNGVYK